jgi:hypothetical protein
MKRTGSFLRISLAAAAALLALAGVVSAQRDFLTPDEVGKVRLAQEPDARLELYISFAQLRVEMLRNYFADQKAGRSAMIHDTLEDYTKIIEAIDTVTDDALRRNKVIEKGMGLVAKGERTMLADLERFDGIEAADRSRYDYVLTDALEATRDSLSLAEEDLRDRKVELVERDAAEKKQREEMLTPEDVKARKKAEQQRTEEDKKRKNLPSLRRPGDPPPADPAAPSKK